MCSAYLTFPTIKSGPVSIPPTLLNLSEALAQNKNYDDIQPAQSTSEQLLNVQRPWVLCPVPVGVRSWQGRLLLKTAPNLENCPKKPTADSRHGNISTDDK